MWMLVIVALFAVNANAVTCPTGCEYHSGVCACDSAPEKSTAADEPAPSDEKPPKDKMPSYQREGVHADTPPSCAQTNNCEDQKKIDASNEGKKAAGIQQ